MAARKISTNLSDNWRFYVYELTDGEDSAYIGKGSGNRLACQRRSFGLDGQEIARFRDEEDAYAFECEAIADRKPALNITPGGNGYRPPTGNGRYRDPTVTEAREMKRVGIRRYVARILLKRYGPFLPHFGIDVQGMKAVADGPYC